jgi:hypothetical protein
MGNVGAPFEYQGAAYSSAPGRVHVDEAFAVLLRSGSEFVALPNNEYLLSARMVEILQEAEFAFDVVNSEAA